MPQVGRERGRVLRYRVDLHWDSAILGSFVGIPSLMLMVILAVMGDVLNGLGYFFGAFIIILTFAPVFMPGAPAQESTACDKFREELNRVRLEDLIEETDVRLSILERELLNANHEQGLGVVPVPIFDTVIDNRRLGQIASGLFSTITLISPAHSTNRQLCTRTPPAFPAAWCDRDRYEHAANAVHSLLSTSPPCRHRHLPPRRNAPLSRGPKTSRAAQKDAVAQRLFLSDRIG